MKKSVKAIIILAIAVLMLTILKSFDQVAIVIAIFSIGIVLVFPSNNKLREWKIKRLHRKNNPVIGDKEAQVKQQYSKSTWIKKMDEISQEEFTTGWNFL